MTEREIEILSNAFMDMVSVFSAIRERRGCGKYVKRLDTILGKLDNLIIAIREEVK